MPQVLALIAAGAGLYAGYKWISRTLAEAQRTARVREAAQRDGEPKDLGALELDQATGVYRPRAK